MYNLSLVYSQCHFKRIHLFLNGGKHYGEQKFSNTVTYATFLVNWRQLFSNQMIFAAGTAVLGHRKKGPKMKTDVWGGSWTDILGLSSAPRGTITSTSALQSAASLANRLFSHSHYGIIGEVVSVFFPEVACSNSTVLTKTGNWHLSKACKLELINYSSAIFWPPSGTKCLESSKEMILNRQT